MNEADNGGVWLTGNMVGCLYSDTYSHLIRKWSAVLCRTAVDWRHESWRKSTTEAMWYGGVADPLCSARVTLVKHGIKADESTTQLSAEIKSE